MYGCHFYPCVHPAADDAKNTCSHKKGEKWEREDKNIPFGMTVTRQTIMLYERLKCGLCVASIKAQ